MKRTLLAIILLSLLMLLPSCRHLEKNEEPIVVGIAWTKDKKAQENIQNSFERAGATVIRLPEVKAEYFSYYDDGTLSDDHMAWLFALDDDSATILKDRGYNEESLSSLLSGIDLVVFSGGPDFSPSLYVEQTEDESEEMKDATRDVSDYLLMTYCLHHDIPLLGICRGMQILGVLSGGTIIQDLETYYEERGISYDNTHRDIEGKTYVMHRLEVIEDSMLYLLTDKASFLSMPSKHHQTLGTLNEENIRVSAVIDTQGVSIIEGIERKDRTFAIGVQFHPEVPSENQEEQKAASTFFSNIIKMMKEIHQ